MNRHQQKAWVEALSDWLAAQPEVEAILLDSKDKEVSIATLGKVEDEEKLRVGFQTVIERIQHEISHAEVEQDVRYGSHKQIEIRELGQDTLIERKSCPTAPSLWHWRSIPWPEGTHEHESWQFLLLMAALCGFFGLLALWMEKSTVYSPWSPFMYGIAMIFGGWDAFKDAMSSLRKRELDIHFLMLVVAVGASSIGQFGEGALLLFLFSLAGAFEHFALDRSSKEIESLYDKKPKTAFLQTESGEEVVEVDRIRPNSIIRVRAGDTFPLDGIVTEGSTSANESALTGESIPVSKEIGDSVYAGSINENGTVLVRVTRRASDSTLQRILSMIQESSKMKTRVESLSEKYGSKYTITVLVITLLAFLYWVLGAGVVPFKSSAEELSAFYRAMTLLVVLSPCALVLSVPSALLASIAWGAKRGILFRGGSALEKICDVGIVAMDKTGTLTTGDLLVQGIESFPPGNEERVGQLAYAMEVRASHPIASAVVRYGKEKKYQELDVDQFESKNGFGLVGKINGQICVVGRREILTKWGQVDCLQSVESSDEDVIEVWLIRGDLVGRILLKDQVREESLRFVKYLKHIGKTVVMLTGDRRANAQKVSNTLGIDECYAELLPEHKVEKVREFTRKEPVMMIGDGVNDAPSLKLAHVSVAMGAKGSGVALESSEVVLMDDSLQGVFLAFNLASRTKKIIIQNLIIALGTVFLMAVLVFLDSVHLAHGVIAHEGSTVIVCLNSLRLLWMKE